MFEIGNTLLSEDIIENEFICNLSKCKGACCIHGDAGAPLDEEEISILQNIYEDVKPYLRQNAIESIEHQGTYIEENGEYTTPLVDGKECVYVIFDKNNFAKCGIEKAYEEGKVNYKKPISCHLYPIRIKKYRNFEAVNYDKWDICSDACLLGKELKIPVFKFLKEPLIRKYGKDWYEELELIVQNYYNKDTNN